MNFSKETYEYLKFITTIIAPISGLIFALLNVFTERKKEIQISENGIVSKKKVWTIWVFITSFGILISALLTLLGIKVDQELSAIQNIENKLKDSIANAKTLKILDALKISLDLSNEQLRKLKIINSDVLKIDSGSKESLTALQNLQFPMTPMDISLGYHYFMKRKYFFDNCPFFAEKLKKNYNKDSTEANLYLTWDDIMNTDGSVQGFLLKTTLTIAFKKDSLIRLFAQKNERSYLYITFPNDLNKINKNIKSVESINITLRGELVAIYIKRVLKDVRPENYSHSNVNGIKQLIGLYTDFNIRKADVDSIFLDNLIVYTIQRPRYNFFCRNGTQSPNAYRFIKKIYEKDYSDYEGP